MSLVKSVEDFLSLHNSSIRSASCLVSWCERRINQSQSKITLWTAMIIGVSFYESPPTAVLVCADFLQSLGAPWYLFALSFRIFAKHVGVFRHKKWFSRRLNMAHQIKILQFLLVFLQHLLMILQFFTVSPSLFPAWFSVFFCNIVNFFAKSWICS